MKNSLFFLLFLIYTSSLLAEDFDTTKLPNGREVEALSSSDFKFTNTDTELLKPSFVNGSFEWKRLNGVVLVPTARVEIKLKDSPQKYQLLYKGKSYSFQTNTKEGFAEVEFSLFERHKIHIFKGETEVAGIEVRRKSDKPKIYIDDTCSRFNIQFKGLVRESITAGCRKIVVGDFGDETALLEIQWLSPELIINSEKSINRVILNKYHQSQFDTYNLTTKKKQVIELTGYVPKRVHRLSTAIGFGPYSLATTFEENGDSRSINEPFAPALFFYANLKLSEGQSIRGFNAAVFKESIFDNAGIYLGSDFGFTLDNRLYFTTLIGMQYLYFKYDVDSPEISEPIFPQGLEFMYKHAFGMRNYIVSGGFFASVSAEVEYQNAWIRWGRNYFWELNYIGWGKDNFDAKMWGLSIGFPVASFF